MKSFFLTWSLFMFSSHAHALFSFEYAQHSGYGDLPIRILISETHATLIRQDTLNAGDAIGVFRANVTKALMDRLTATTPDLIESPPTPPPTRDSSYFVIRLQTDARKVELRVAHHPDALEKIKDLMREINVLETKTPWKPFRTLALDLTNDFTIRLTNAGTETIHVPFQTLGLTIESIDAKAPPPVPGFTPPPRVWELASGKGTLPSAIDIAPGTSTEYHLPLLVPASKDKLYRVRFFARGAIDPTLPDIAGTAVSKAMTPAEPRH